MPGSRADGQVKLNVWLASGDLEAAKKRAAERGETVSEAVRKFLHRYSKGA